MFASFRRPLVFKLAQQRSNFSTQVTQVKSPSKILNFVTFCTVLYLVSKQYGISTGEEICYSVDYKTNKVKIDKSPNVFKFLNPNYSSILSSYKVNIPGCFLNIDDILTICSVRVEYKLDLENMNANNIIDFKQNISAYNDKIYDIVKHYLNNNRLSYEDKSTKTDELLKFVNRMLKESGVKLNYIRVI